jgi:hypothetical protein
MLFIAAVVTDADFLVDPLLTLILVLDIRSEWKSFGLRIFRVSVYLYALVHKRQGIFLTSSQNYLSYQPW